MSIGARYRQAWPMTLGIHVFQTLLAASFAVPLIGSVSMPDVSLQPAAADALAGMRVWSGLDELDTRRMVLPLLAAVLNYPWLSVAWLRAMDQPDSFVGHARYAMGRYTPAAVIALGGWVCVGVLGAAAVGAVHGLKTAFGAALDDRTLDVLRVATLAPFAWLACYALSLQDRAHAAISCGSAGVREALGIALRHTNARRVGARGVLIVGQLVVTLLAAGMPRALLGAGELAAGGVMVSGQVAALGMSCVRAGWLAYVMGWRRLQLRG
jgi:hypothetical protein